MSVFYNRSNVCHSTQASDITNLIYGTSGSYISRAPNVSPLAVLLFTDNGICLLSVFTNNVICLLSFYANNVMYLLSVYTNTLILFMNWWMFLVVAAHFCCPTDNYTHGVLLCLVYNGSNPLLVYSCVSIVIMDTSYYSILNVFLVNGVLVSTVNWPAVN